MRKLLFITLLFTILISFKSYTDDNDLCEVNKRNGKLVFWNCDPTQEYDVVFTFKGSGINLTQSAQSANMVKDAIVQASIDRTEFDAIIVGNTEIDEAIKFKQNTIDKKNSLNLGRARRINGVPVFIDCTPLQKYENIKRVRKYRARNNHVYWSGIKLAMEITKNGKKGDALVIGEDQFHHWIKFN